MFAAGLWTTPTDLARWSMAITAAYNGGTGGPIRPETARAMLTPGMNNWGLGVSLQGEGRDFRFWHSGINEGFRAVMMSYPERRQAVVIMANGDNGNEILGPVRIAVGRVLGWPNSEQQVITPAAVRREPRIEQVGYYTSERWSIHVGMTEDGLILIPSRGDPFEAIPQAEGVYAAANGGGPLEFKRDARSGRITGLAIAGMTLRRAP
jgi:CubicO group peptidase (beta-lactamase class C family)